MRTTRIELELTDSEIDQLRQVIDHLPLSRYAPLICAVLPKLPIIESDAEGPGADTDPQVLTPSGPVGGFSLHALTPKAQRMLPHIERVLGTVEVDLS